MRDKLIEIFRNTNYQNRQNGLTANLATQFTEYALGEVVDTLLANGIIVPPCKVGDALYYPSFGTDRVLLYKVISIKLNSKGLYVVCENHLSKSQMTHKAEQIGKTIFLTKAEAERALAERRTNND